MTKSFKQNVTSAVAITLEISQMFQGHGFHCETNTGPCVRTAILYFCLTFLNAFRCRQMPCLAQAPKQSHCSTSLWLGEATETIWHTVT